MVSSETTSVRSDAVCRRYRLWELGMSHCVIGMAKLLHQICWKWGVHEIEAEPWLTLNLFVSHSRVTSNQLF